MVKNNLNFIVCCANGGGTSLMCRLSLEKALKSLSITPGKIHHCALAEGKSSAAQYDVLLCPRNFENMFDDAKEKGVVVIGLKNVMSDAEIAEKLKEFGITE